MKKHFIYWICILWAIVFTIPFYGDETGRTIANPQLLMMGARGITLGGPNPTLRGDINSMMINPAILGTLGSMPLSLSSYQIMNYFDYKLLTMSLPLSIKNEGDTEQDQYTVNLGASYGSVGLTSIPETVFVDNRIRQTSSFNSGYDIFLASAGTEFYNMMGFNRLSLGASGKLFRHYIRRKERFSYAIDVGLIGVYFMDYEWLDKVSFGASLLNIISTPLQWETTGDKAYLPQNLLLGGRMDMLDETFSVFLNNGVEGLTLSGEYFLEDDMIFRGGSDFTHAFLGTGLIINNIMGFGDQRYNVRFDYNMTLYSGLVSDVNNHHFSITIIGDARPSPPKILKPIDDQLISSKKINLSGIGPKNTTIRMFNNGTLSRTTLSNKYGSWSYQDFPIKEGLNDLYVQSYSIEKDISQESDHILINRDTTPPEINISVFPRGNQLVAKIESTDPLFSVKGYLEDQRLAFEESQKGTWVATALLPSEMQDDSYAPSQMKKIHFQTKDEAGNTVEPPGIPFFLEVSYPKDQHVHYAKQLRIIGKTSPLVSVITLGKYPIYIDPKENFSISESLEPGKNLLQLTMKTLEGDPITYKMRILRLIAYKDVDKFVPERREIEFMSTLKVIEGDDDDYFYPNKFVTKGFITKVMVLGSGLDVPDEVGNIFLSDVTKDTPHATYIMTAIENGLVFVNPDGSFNPNEELVMDDVILMLTNAGVIGEEEVEDGDEKVTRARLAQFLSYIPKYELQIEELIDWEKGYE